MDAVRTAVRALLAGDRALAYDTILGDLPINREIRAIDGECHAFVARHLPSAGHLRFVSSVLRLNVELERIGDYAVAICREAVQLKTAPPEAIARDVELMAEQAREVLQQALRAWNERNAELARGTIRMASQAARLYPKAVEDLLREGCDPAPSGPSLRDLFALLQVFNRLGRVADQAKNICEETLFAVAGETKAPKVYRVLFVDERDDCLSQLAAAYARKAFPESGRYDSAGWAPADELAPRCRDFLERHGFATSELAPARLEPLLEELARYHVIVSFGGDVRPHLPEVPFHTVVLEWDLDPGTEGPTGMDAAYKEIAVRVRRLLETLRGEGAS